MFSKTEIFVDNFAGGGGASTGVELAIGKSVDIAINHDPAAIAMHRANHPDTEHYCENVYDIDPVVVCAGRKVALAWFSPDCKHFSKAKGGKPVEKSIRGLAWIVLRWAAKVRPRVIMLENVEEFRTWGPIRKGRPIKKLAGQTFEKWKSQLQALGYKLDYRELRACDYGAPTIRKRFFLIARCDGQAIKWPEPTYGDPSSLEVQSRRLKPWRTAAEIIDWSIECKSIFERKKPLCENTMKRIAKGLKKFVLDAPEPFIIPINQSSDVLAPSILSEQFNNVGGKITDPLKTILTGNHHYVLSPYLAQIGQQKFAGDGRSRDLREPISTIVTKAEHLLVAPTLIQYHGEQSDKETRGQNLKKPLMAVDSSNRYGLVMTFISKYFAGGYKGAGSEMDKPLPTVTSVDHNALVTAYMLHFYGTSIGNGMDKPLGTITAQGQHIAEVQAFLVKYYGQGNGQGLNEPLHTITTKDRFGLVTVKGIDYQIVDIGMRMLNPRELFNAQGFPSDYIIEKDAEGHKYTQKAQVARCGNAVPPPFAKALVEDNLPELCNIAEVG
jgi:DNA (cytosine-5)-methyltransferase 1